MATSILVVDANREFGILIRQSLEDSGRYAVTLATSGREGLERCSEQPYELAIVDFDLPDMTGREVVEGLRQESPSLRIVAIPHGSEAGSQFADLPVEGILAKPFYLPELPRILEEALTTGIIGQVRWDKPQPTVRTTPSKEPATTTPEPVQSESEGPAAEAELETTKLQDLIDETEAIAALIIGPRGVLGRAGLSNAPAQEILRILQRHRGGDQPAGAIARYVRPSSSTEDLLLYGMPLPSGPTLALLFPADLPFGSVRRAAQLIAEGLTGRADHQQEDEERMDRAVDAVEATLPSDWVPESSLSEAQQAMIQELTEVDLPPPDPDPAATSSRETPKGISLPKDWIPAERPAPSYLDFLEEPAAGRTPSNHTGREGPEARADRSPLIFNIGLFPRFPHHRLTGSLPRELAEWSRRFCLAWDWRPLQVEVQEQCLLLRVSLKPKDTPADVVKQLQEDLSRRILERHPELQKDLPSRRFWASDVLLTAGDKPSEADLKRSLARVRENQGLEG